MLRLEGLSGHNDLIDWPLPAGDWEWRLRLPTRGNDNRGGAAWRQGACTATPGASTVVLVRS